jgi:hypothetical protein
MEALTTANAEMNSTTTERRILTALQRLFPVATQHFHIVGDEVLTFREKYNESEGPYQVVEVEVKTVAVLIKDDEKRLSAYRIKNFVRDEAQTSF